VLIDCDTCEVRDIACDDCVVSVLLGTPRVPAAGQPYAQVLRAGEPGAADQDDVGDAGGGVELDDEESRALRVLAECGLVPPLRLAPPGSDSGPRRSHAV
jgi:hypothetical protein